jgi:DNA-binding MarR family transcriptional regulator
LRVPIVHSPVLRRFDQDGDGDFDLDDVKKIVKKVSKKVKDGKDMPRCTRCGGMMNSRRNKYDTGLCVDCYRNPEDHERCKAVSVTTKERCKRRVKKDGYCGIHLKSSN